MEDVVKDFCLKFNEQLKCALSEAVNDERKNDISSEKYGEFIKGRRNEFIGYLNYDIYYNFKTINEVETKIEECGPYVEEHIIWNNNVFVFKLKKNSYSAEKYTQYKNKKVFIIHVSKDGEITYNGKIYE